MNNQCRDQHNWLWASTGRGYHAVLMRAERLPDTILDGCNPTRWKNRYGPVVWKEFTT